MAKVVRSFRTKAAAKEWILRMKEAYSGKVVGGSTYATDGGRMRAYVFGDITDEMAKEMRPKYPGNVFFEYKK